MPPMTNERNQPQLHRPAEHHHLTRIHCEPDQRCQNSVQHQRHPILPVQIRSGLSLFTALLSPWFPSPYVPSPCLYGAQGRIRTSVARKERQIYSLLPLTARPPVPNSLLPGLNHPPEGTCPLCSEGMQLRAPTHACPLPRTPQPSGEPPELWSMQLSGITAEMRPGARKLRFAGKPLPLSPLVPASVLWSWRRDLNPRPSDYKSDALPAELRQLSGDSSRPAIPPETFPEGRIVSGHTPAFRLLGTEFKVSIAAHPGQTRKKPKTTAAARIRPGPLHTA